MAHVFDLRGLFGAVDAERQRQGLSWEALSRQVGVSASTIRRFGLADDAEADGVLALIRWLGVAPEDFVETASATPQKLQRDGGGFVRVDMDEVAKAAGELPKDQRRTRTTIQKLVEAALAARQPVATLTHHCES